MAVVDSKILEIMVGEGEEELYNAEYFAAEQHRKTLGNTGEKPEGWSRSEGGTGRQNFITDSHTK